MIFISEKFFFGKKSWVSVFVPDAIERQLINKLVKVKRVKTKKKKRTRSKLR